MLGKLFSQIRDNRILAAVATAFALVSSWIGQRLAELFQHWVYGWIIEALQPMVADREAALIASVLSYLPGIITAIVVFIGVFWVGTHAFKHRNKPNTTQLTPSHPNHAQTLGANTPPVRPARAASSVPTKSDLRDSPPSAQLPPNATFSFKGRVFYFIRHNYSHEENIEFRSALRDAYDCIFHNAAPISATYNGPVVQFTRNWTSTIQSQGAAAASQTLDEIEKQATNANVQLMRVLEKRPYFRSDLQYIIGAPGGQDDLRGAIHKYQVALKSIPDQPAQQLIVLALSESEKRLEAAHAAHVAWIAQVNTKINGTRDELEALARLE